MSKNLAPGTRVTLGGGLGEGTIIAGVVALRDPLQSEAQLFYLVELDKGGWLDETRAYVSLLTVDESAVETLDDVHRFDEWEEPEVIEL